MMQPDQVEKKLQENILKVQKYSSYISPHVTFSWALDHHWSSDVMEIRPMQNELVNKNSYVLSSLE